MEFERTIKLMEYDKNLMPPMDLFPRIMGVVHFVFDHLRDPGLSDHARGASPALDAALYDLPETTRMAQIELNFDGDGREVL